MTPRWHRTAAAMGGLVLVAAIAGCGGAQEPAARPTETPRTDLTVTLTGTAKDDVPQVWTLTCAPDGGTHPHPDQACAALTRNAVALQPVAKGQVCTELYGGPQKATVTGTWTGKDVDATLSRANGCEIKRWSDLAGLLPAVS